MPGPFLTKIGLREQAIDQAPSGIRPTIFFELRQFEGTRRQTPEVVVEPSQKDTARRSGGWRLACAAETLLYIRVNRIMEWSVVRLLRVVVRQGLQRPIGAVR